MESKILTSQPLLQGFFERHRMMAELSQISSVNSKILAHIYQLKRGEKWKI
jgi:hypothetical protein